LFLFGLESGKNPLTFFMRGNVTVAQISVQLDPPSYTKYINFELRLNTIGIVTKDFHVFKVLPYY